MERWKQAEEEHDDCGHGAGERCGKTLSKCHQKNGQYDHGRRDPEIIYKDIPVKLGHESNDQSDQDHSPDIARPHIICHKAILLFRIRSRWNHHPISYYNTLLLKKSQ